MSERKAANVILEKVRAMYGKRLFPADYKNMVSRVDIPQLAAYIKNETYLGECLQNFSEIELNYTVLEHEIYASMYARIERLLKYDFADNTEFFDFVVTENEVKIISNSLRSIVSGSHEPRQATGVPSYLAKKSKINLVEVYLSKSFKELLSHLNNSKYKKLILDNYGGDEENIKIENIQVALMTDYIQTFFDMLETSFSGGTRRELEETLRIFVDTTNIPLIFRLKHYFKYESSEIKANLVPFTGIVSKKEINRLIEFPTDNPRLFLEQCLKALLGKNYDTSAILSVEQATHRLAYMHYNHLVRYSVHPTCVYLAYVELMEIETRNLINIIEGIKYRVTPQEIEDLIIY